MLLPDWNLMILEKFHTVIQAQDETFFSDLEKQINKEV